MFCLFLNVLMLYYWYESSPHPYDKLSALVRKLPAPLRQAFSLGTKPPRTPTTSFQPLFTAANLWVLPLYDDYLRAMPRIWYDKCKDVWYLCKVLGDNLLWGWLGLLFFHYLVLRAARSSDTSFVGYPVRRAPRSSTTPPFGHPSRGGEFREWRSLEECCCEFLLSGFARRVANAKGSQRVA